MSDMRYFAHMFFLSVLVCGIELPANVSAADIVQTVMYPLVVEKVHDGDTIRATIVLPWKVGLISEDIRLLGVDAWEITRARRTVGEITDEEIAKGMVARDDLIKLLAESQSVWIQPGPRYFDPYGRPLGRLFIVPKDAAKGAAAVDVAQWMISRGHQRKSIQSDPK